MKKFLTFIFGLVLIAVIALITLNVTEKVKSTAGTAKSFTMQERQTLSLPEGNFVYQVKDGEATIKGELLDRVLIGKNVTVTYRNKTNESLRPSYTIKFYNKYGLLIGKEKVGSSSLADNLIGPEEVSSESIHFERYNITEILEQTDVRVNEDFNNIHWIVISDSNSVISVAAN